MLPLLLALLLAAAPHPNSLSSSVVTVRGARVTVELRCQALSLLEVTGPQADADADGLLSQAELDAVRPAAAAHLLAHYRLRAGSGGDPSGGTPLAGTLAALSPGDVEPDLLGVTQWIEATLLFEHDAPLPDLLLDITVFQATSPDHRDLCELRFNDDPPVEALFWQGEPVRHYTPPPRAEEPPAAGAAPAAAPADFAPALPLAGWVRLGVDHILTGWDHLCFLAGLLVAAGGLAALLGVVTAFTLAHSLTLALAALELVSVPSRPVELLIAASIAWVGLANLLQRRPVARWKEAFGFGLVHGLGFAGFLGEALAGESRRLVPLLGFNLGVEAGQLALVLLAVALLALARSALRRPAAAPGGEPRWLVPRAPRLVLSAGVAAAGLWWLAERALGG